MKLLITIIFLLISNFGFAQVPDAKGEIQTGPSLPGSIGFIIQGEPARLIYDQLSSKEINDVYYIPSGSVQMKIGDGVTCRLAKQDKTYWCEITVVPRGILVP